MAPIISSIVYGEQAESWEYWFVKSIKKVMPAAIYNRITPNFAVINKRLSRNPGYETKMVSVSYSSYTKIVLPTLLGGNEAHRQPVWMMDCDLLVLRPLVWKPYNKNTVIAMAKGGDKKYLEFLKKAEVPVLKDITFNAGVIWGYENFTKIWKKWYNNVYDVIENTSYSIGETMWNAIWHDLNNQGKAEILPQGYNQIITEHGPFNATVFHLAGTPHQFRKELMKSYFKYFFGEYNE